MNGVLSLLQVTRLEGFPRWRKISQLVKGHVRLGREAWVPVLFHHLIYLVSQDPVTCTVSSAIAIDVNSLHSVRGEIPRGHTTTHVQGLGGTPNICSGNCYLVPTKHIYSWHPHPLSWRRH